MVNFKVVYKVHPLLWKKFIKASVELNKAWLVVAYCVCILYGVIGFGVIYARPLQATNGL